MTKEIILANGQVALVDDEDFERVNAFRWYMVHDGYARCRMGKKQVYMHRFIMGAKKGDEFDHINTIKLDNQKENCRKVTRAENLANRPKSRASKNPYKGVNASRSKRWVARIRKDGKTYHLGTFDDAESAARAYDKKAFELYGSIARLNLPETNKENGK